MMQLRASPEAVEWVRARLRSRAPLMHPLLALTEDHKFAEQELAQLVPLDETTRLRLGASGDTPEGRRLTMRDTIAASGYRLVHSVTIACVFVDQLNRLTRQFPYRGFWRRASAIGLLTMYGARVDREHIDLAYSAGFLSDVGSLLAAVHAAGENERAAREATSERISVAIPPAPQAVATELATTLAELWHMPPVLREAMGGPSAESSQTPILELIASARRLAAEHLDGGPPATEPRDLETWAWVEEQGGADWLLEEARGIIYLAFVDDRPSRAA